MQDVDQRAGLAGDPDEPPRRGQRGFGVPPGWMARRIAGAPPANPLAQPELVFRVERGATPGVSQDLTHARVVGDEEVAGGRAHEYLDAGGARQALQLRDALRVLGRAAYPEGMIAVHAPACSGELVF